MCGIAGIISQRPEKTAQIYQMSEALLHRGPDAGEFYFGNGCSFAHRRLSIIDTSDLANQPMTSLCGNFVIVFNGEIYNYKDLAELLLRDFPEKYKGNFKTHSDTEIVLELMVSYGSNAIPLLNGMFAFALYNVKTRDLLICRDRLGIKPLFYSVVKSELYFASELKALFSVIDQRTLNCSAVLDYLHLGYFPGEDCVIIEAQKFPAGHYAVFKNGQWSFTRYYQPSVSKEREKQCDDYAYCRAQLKSILEVAVKDSLISDVPLGVFLSGGIDSGIVSALAARFTTTTLKSFTIASADHRHDESLFAEKFARIIGTDHHVLTMDEKMMLSVVEKVLTNMDEPLADSSIFPTYIVSEFARKHVTVALSGDGGDEQFMGYGAYQWAKRIQNPLFPFLRPLAYCALNKKRHAQFFHPDLLFSLQSNIFSIEQNFFPSFELETLENRPYQFITPEIFSELSLQEAQALFDLSYYLKDDLLVKVDRASMLNSLEVRPPLLDHRVLDFSAKIPTYFKTKGKQTKIILKDILADYIPKDVFDRPKKGFSIPMQRWLNSELYFILDQYVVHLTEQEQKLVRFIDIEALLDDYLTGRKPWLYNRLWAIAVLIFYIRKNKINIPLS